VSAPPENEPRVGEPKRREGVSFRPLLTSAWGSQVNGYKPLNAQLLIGHAVVWAEAQFAPACLRLSWNLTDSGDSRALRRQYRWLMGKG
jgi:hypothetical protein